MNDQNQLCPKCGTELTELKGGLRCCPACGFEGEQKKLEGFAFSRAGRALFWVALLTPATMALASFLVGRASDKLRDTGVGIGLAALLVSFAASIYCGVWLAQRFTKVGTGRVMFGISLVLGLVLVNFIIIFAGCAGNVRIGQ